MFDTLITIWSFSVRSARFIQSQASWEEAGRVVVVVMEDGNLGKKEGIKLLFPLCFLEI